MNGPKPFEGNGESMQKSLLQEELNELLKRARNRKEHELGMKAREVANSKVGIDVTGLPFNNQIKVLRPSRLDHTKKQTTSTSLMNVKLKPAVTPYSEAKETLPYEVVRIEPIKMKDGTQEGFENF